jgi:hypothetical protein
MTNHLYGFGATSKLQGINWPEAKAAVAGMKSCCGGVRPHLVSVTSKAENDVVVALVDAAQSWSATRAHWPHQPQPGHRLGDRVGRDQRNVQLPELVHTRQRELHHGRAAGQGPRRVRHPGGGEANPFLVNGA